MEDTLIKRVMPNSLEAEQSVVGAMIMDGETIGIAAEMLNPDDFYHQQCGKLFEALLKLHEENTPIDVVTLQSKLKEMKVPKEMGSVEFIRDLITSVPTSANIKHYCEIVKSCAMKRKLIRTMEDLANDCYVGEDSIEGIMDKTEHDVFKILSSRQGGDVVPIRQVVANAMETIALASRNAGSVTGVSTGFIDLDYKTAGLQPSDLILVAARPSMGKTAFVLNLAHHMAVHEKKSVAIFSLEMSKEQLVNRMFSLESRVDAQKLRTGNLTEAEWVQLSEGASVLGQTNLLIDDTPGISIGELRSKCRKFKLDPGLDIIIIDYLQLMTGSGRSESRQQEISEISRSLKGLARELKVPVVALSQLSRAVEQRPDHRPMMSDLRESGAIEQDADVVMFIYRDDYYNKDSDMKGISEIIIAKQRNGSIGTVNLAWLQEYTRFANLER